MINYEMVIEVTDRSTPVTSLLAELSDNVREFGYIDSDTELALRRQAVFTVQTPTPLNDEQRDEVIAATIDYFRTSRELTDPQLISFTEKAPVEDDRSTSEQ